MFELLVLCAGLFGGAVASVAGPGIGSVLTPAIAGVAGTKRAIAAVSIRMRSAHRYVSGSVAS